MNLASYKSLNINGTIHLLEKSTHTGLYSLINGYKVLGNSCLKEPWPMLTITFTDFILVAILFKLTEKKNLKDLKLIDFFLKKREEILT